MGKFQIFQDGRAAGSAPVSGSDFVTKDYLSGSLPDQPWVRSTGSGSAILKDARYASSNTARGEYSVAQGSNNMASGSYSHAEGSTCGAYGDASHAEGENTNAYGRASHTEGHWSQASGTYSHAEGDGTRAVGPYSHAEGSQSTALGTASHAGGYLCRAIGTGSHAEGWRTTASCDYEFAVGKFNATASRQIFSVGVGFYMNGVNRNAIAVLTSSNNYGSASVFIQGIGGYKGNNPVEGTNDLATAFAKLTGSVASASYNSTDKKIYFYNNAGTAVASVDATDFIKDGMVDSVAVSESYLVLTFNTDAGKEPVSMSLTQIFNPDNYYTKSDVDTLLTTMSVGDVNVIEAVEFNGTASTITNKTASIVLETGSFENVKIFTATLSSSWNGNSWDYTVILDNNVTGQDLIDATQNGIVYVDVDHNYGIRYHRFLVQGEVIEGDDLRVPRALLYAVYPFDRSNSNGVPDLETVSIPIGGSEGPVKRWQLLTPESVATASLGGYYQDEFIVPSAYLVSASIAAAVSENIWVRGTGSGSAQLSGSMHSANGALSTAEGGRTNSSNWTGYAQGVSSHIEGAGTEANGEASHAEGFRTVASGSWSHAEGSRSLALGSGSHTEGTYTTASGNYSHAEGSASIARGIASHAEGFQTVASGNYSHAEGRQTIASSGLSHAEGSASVASGWGTHAEGFRTTASGQYSHAEGWATKAIGSSSHAEGSGTQATNDHSHAEGQLTTARGGSSHAEGLYTLASQSYTHAEGLYTTASGWYSHVEGSGSRTLATATGSHAEGQGTIASNNYEHAQGRCNATASSQIFSVGVGSNDAARKNAVSIITGSGTVPSASIYVYGVGTYDGTNPTPGVNDLAAVIASLTGSQGGDAPLIIDVSSAPWTNGGSGSFAVSDRADGYWTVDPALFTQASEALKAGKAVYLYNLNTYGQDYNCFLYQASRGFNDFINFNAGYDSNVGGIKAVEFHPNGNIFVRSMEYAMADIYNYFTWGPGEGSGSAVLTNWNGEIPATATGQFAVAQGYAVQASGTYSHAEGYYTLASGAYSHAEGNSTIAVGTYSHAEGYDTTASGMYSHAEGQYAIADGDGSHAEGSRTSASANYSHAEGREAIASGNYAHAEGFRTIASGMYSHAEGSKSLASGQWSHAEGGYTTASATYAHAEGSSTQAIGSSSHAEGTGSVASGVAAHAEGFYAQAIASGSHAEGIGTIASGAYSHAEGSASIARGLYSHAEGRSTIASGAYSHAEGWASEASGEGSYAAGYTVFATNPYEFAVGRPNFTSSRQIFSVGVGQPRAFGLGVNAISVITGSNPSASIYIYGVGSYNGTNPQPGTNDIASVIKQISASIGSGSGITSESDPIYLADSASLKNAATWVGSNSASLIASGTLAKNVTAITASLVASASVAKTASSSAAALSAKSASWDALVGLPAVTAADNGKILRVVNGAWALVDPVTVYSGQGAPDSALGQDGDIYLQS